MTSSFQNALVREAMFKFALRGTAQYSYEEILELPECYANRMFLSLDDLYVQFDEAFMTIMDSTIKVTKEHLVTYSQVNCDFLLMLNALDYPGFYEGDYDEYLHHVNSNGPYFEEGLTQNRLEENGTLLEYHNLARFQKSGATIEQIKKIYLDLSYSIYESVKIPSNPDSKPKFDSIVNMWHHFHYRVLAVIDHADKIAQGADG